MVRIKGVEVCTFDNKREKLGRIPVLAYLSSSIWASPAQTLVNTVNVVERRYPSKLEYKVKDKWGRSQQFTYLV